MPFTDSDVKHLRAADGYIELGMWPEANDELEQVNPEVRHLPAVLVIRLQIYQTFEKWELMQTVAQMLALHDPKNPQWAISWAYATRRAESIEAAKRILLEAVEQHPNCALMHYNLACYECQLGEIDVAKARLQHALKIDPQIRLMALDEEDLKPLWDQIAGG